MLFRIGHVLSIVAAMKQTAVDHGVKSFETSFEKLGSTSVFRDIHHGKSGVPQGSSSATGGEQLDSHLGKSLGKFHQTRLVRNRKQRS